MHPCAFLGCIRQPVYMGLRDSHDVCDGASVGFIRSLTYRNYFQFERYLLLWVDDFRKDVFSECFLRDRTRRAQAVTLD